MKIWKGKEQPISAFFDQGTNLTGELKFAGIVRIDGSFHGSIDGGETLIVGSNAVIHADIRVREIEIHGQVFGNLEVESRTEIYSSGKFKGDIHTPVLTIHPGGVLDGHSHMLQDASFQDNQQDGSFRESTEAVQDEHIDPRRREDK